MKVIDPGHAYELDGLKSDHKQVLVFMKDAKLHGDGHDGTCCQEVLRALIDRVQSLEQEKPWPNNQKIIGMLRLCILEFEYRALFYKVADKDYAIEALTVAQDGHLLLD